MSNEDILARQRGVNTPPLRHDEEYCRHLEAILYPLGHARWSSIFLSAPVEAVPLASITDSNQVGLAWRHLGEKLGAPDQSPVWLIRDGSRLTVWDGSHRWAAEWVKRGQVVSARAVDLEVFRQAGRSTGTDAPINRSAA